MLQDPINDPENADLSEAHVCRHCHAHIRPGAEQPFGGDYYHHTCVPAGPEPDVCRACGTTDHLWRPFRSAHLYCTECIPDPVTR